MWFLGSFVVASTALHAQNMELLDRADSSFAEGNFEQLVSDCDAAIAEFPDTAWLYYYRGMAEFAFGENAAALADFDKAISLETVDPEPYVARARLHYYSGNYDLAHKDVRAALKRAPGYLEAYLLRAEIYLDEDILSEAWADLETARKLAPRDPEVYCLRSEYFLLYGDALQAVKEAGTAIKLAPDDARGYATQASAFEAADDLAHAKQDIDLAIQLEPEDYGLLASRAMILDAMGDREGAMKDLERYMGKDSLAWDAYLTRAWMYMQDSNWTGAEADLFAAQKIQPEESSIQDQLGFLYVLQGRFIEGKAILQPLVAKKPNQAFARANLAYCLLETGDADAALKEVQQAIKLDEYEPRSYFYRAAIYSALKKPAKACEDLQKAKDLGFVDYYGEAEYAAMKRKACTQ